MSIFVPIDSACGRITTSIDIFDADLNPWGVICCSECETLIESRQAWAAYWNESPMSDPTAKV